MDITVYLPDELGREAKAAELNLSRLLRDAVTDELTRRKEVEATLKDPQTYEIDIENENGDVYTGRVTGKLLVMGKDVDIYLTDDERVILYDRMGLKYWEVDDLEQEARYHLTDDEYVELLPALGIKPTIDI